MTKSDSQKLDEIAKLQQEMLEVQKRMLERQEQFGKNQEQFEKRQEQFDQRQDRSEERMDRFERETKLSFDRILEIHARMEQRFEEEQQKNEDLRIRMLAYADRTARQHENFQIEKAVLGAQIDRIALNDANQNRKIVDLTQRVERLEKDAA